MTSFWLDWSVTSIDGANTVSSSGQTTGFDVEASSSAQGIEWFVATFSGVPALLTNQVQDPAQVTIRFDTPVKNLSFTLFDADANLSGWDDKATIVALDAVGNQAPVTFTDLAFQRTPAGIATNTNAGTVGVSISGPIVSLKVVYDVNGGPDVSGVVGISNIDFRVVATDGDVQSASEAKAINVAAGKDTLLERTAVVEGSASDFDILNLLGADVDFITYDVDNPEAGVVTFTDGDTMKVSEIERVVPCFTPGTAIATPKGEVLVEDLKVGDRVLTRDNGIQTISWFAEKRLDHGMLRACPHLRPILIRAGAMGDGMPERDMLVSPSHRMLIVSHHAELYFGQSEVLITAKHMLAMEGVEVSDQPYITYIHFMCDNHEIVLSDGAWSESFQPADYTLKGFDNEQRAELFELFPELETKEGVTAYRAARRTLNRREAKLLFSR